MECISFILCSGLKRKTTYVDYVVHAVDNMLPWPIFATSHTDALAHEKKTYNDHAMEGMCHGYLPRHSGRRVVLDPKETTLCGGLLGCPGAVR
jgi:hypothetical protein